MTTQVTAVRLTASGQIDLGATRVRAINVVGAAAAGLITLIDGTTNGTGGTTVAVIDYSAGAGGGSYIRLPGLGLKFSTNCYATITGTPTGVTFFIG